nr:RNA-directed DNA polymerase, eukaryota [Tanacetum cinerariifolium]
MKRVIDKQCGVKVPHDDPTSLQATERLVNNLCTVWIDRYKLHANITRFQRHHVSENKFVNKVGVGVTKSHNHPLSKVNTKENFSTWVDKSYMGAVKGDKQYEGGDPTSSLAIVLGDECVVSKDLSLALLGKVKEFASLANLQVAIGNEDFAGIKIKYMGELWAEGRIAWVEIEGVPFKLWSGNTFTRIAAKWGKLLGVDDQEENCCHSKRICIYMKSGRSVVDEFKIIHRGKIYWIRANETPGWVPDFTDDSDDDDQNELNTNEDGTDNHNLGGAGNDNLNDGAGNDSDAEEVPDTLFEEEGMAKKQVEGAKLDINGDNSEDPFNLYPLLNKNKATNGSENKSGSIKYPPGFTPTNTRKDENSTYVVEEKNCYGDEVNNGNIEEINDAASGNRMHNSTKEDFLQYEISKWKGEVIIMGNFNEVRYKSNRFGSNFNVHGAQCFNSFISASGLVEVTLGGMHFTWCHKSAKKMSKLDRFLVSENLLSSCPHLNAITLERYLLDHRPILLWENHYDYGPTSFRFYHHWIKIEGFCKLVEDTWKDSPGKGFNAIKILMGKLKYLKKSIREWNKSSMVCRKNIKAQYKKDLEAVELILDSGQGVEEDIRNRSDIIHKIQHYDKIDWLEMVQKAKVKWAVEGDENSKFFHGMLNKKRSILNIQGVLVDGVWVDSPNSLHSDQCRDLEIEVTNEEIKRDVWECGTDKAPGPDGFTFGFFRHFWYLVEQDVYEAVSEVSQWCKTKKKQAIIFKVDFEKAYDSVRWDYLDEVLCKFGFGEKWRRVSGLKINMSKSKIMGIHVNNDKISRAVDKLGCLVLKTPFLYLGSMVGGAMYRLQTWNDNVDGVRRRLSK